MSQEKTTPARSGTADPALKSDSAQDVSRFLERARTLGTGRTAGQGRLVLALDATMSRQPTWDLACQLQAQMFDAAGRTGRLEMQLAYFRGFGECRASKFVRDADLLKDLMSRIDCRGGHTQIGKILSHALKEHGRGKVNAVVYIGDAMEETIDDLADKAGRLGLAGIPVFLFQEGHDPVARQAFKEIARLTRGAWFGFDRDSAATLARLLSAVVVYATGGLAALEARDTPEDRLLIANMRNSGPR